MWHFKEIEEKQVYEGDIVGGIFDGHIDLEELLSDVNQLVELEEAIELIFSFAKAVEDKELLECM